MLNLLISLQGLHSVEGPQLLDSALEFQMDDQLIFSAQKLNQKLHENVKDVCFVDVAQSVECQSLIGVDNRT